MGVRPGERVAGLLPRTPDLLTVLLGTLRAGAVYQPVFTAFGPKAIETRLSASSPRLVVTDTANRPKLDGRSEEHTSELQSLMRISYALFCLKQNNHLPRISTQHIHTTPQS